MGGRQGRGSATKYAGICSLLAIVQCALAATTYTVGGSAGWDLNVDYKAWSAKNNFKVGDTLVFKYTPGAHSVFQVSEANLKACNLTSPLKAYQTGDDNVVLTQATTYYFICGVPTHCTQYGMAVTIPVSEAGSSSSAPSPAPTVSPVPKISPSPSPQKSVPSPAPAPARSSPSPSKTTPSPSPSENSPSPNSPSVTSPTPNSPSSTSSPSPATLISPPSPQSPPVSSTPSSSTTPPPQAEAPSPPASPPKNAASTLRSGSLGLLSAVLLGGFLLIFH